MDRRAFLAATGALFAGCSTGSSGGETQSVPESLEFSVSKTEVAEETVELRDSTWVEQEGEKYAATGVVENVGRERLARIRLDADFADSGGSLLVQRWTDARFLSPGEHYQFAIPLVPPSGVAKCNIRVSARRDPYTPENDGHVVNENVEWSSFQNDTKSGLTGTLKNVSDGFLERVYVYVNFYAGDELLGWGKDGTADVHAGGTHDWQVAFDGDPDAVERHQVVVLVQPEMTGGENTA